MNTITNTWRTNDKPRDPIFNPPVHFTTAMNIIVRLIISTLAVLIADLLLRGVSLGAMDTLNGVLTALLTAAVLALLNGLLKPVLVILTLPITFLTLGLFVLVINAGLVLLAAKLIPGFTVESFWWALGFSLVLSVVQGVLNALDGGAKRKEE